MVDAPPADRVQGHRENEISVGAAPRQERKMLKSAPVRRVAYVGGTTLHEHAPTLVVQDVHVVHLERDHFAVGRMVEGTVPAYPNHDVLVADRVVDGEDRNRVVDHRAEPPDARDPEVVEALRATEGFEMVL
jgi:hypothetical protein